MAVLPNLATSTVSRLEMLLEAIPLPGLAIDERCVVLAANAEARLLLERCGRQNEQAYCRIFPDLGTLGCGLVAQAIEHGQPMPAISAHPLASTMVLRHHARPLTTTDGRTVAIVSLVAEEVWGKTSSLLAWRRGSDPLAKLAAACLDFERADLLDAVAQALSDLLDARACAVWREEEPGCWPAQLSYFELEPASGSRKAIAPPGLDSLLHSVVLRRQPTVARLPMATTEAAVGEQAPGGVVATPLVYDGEPIGALAAVGALDQAWPDRALSVLTSAGGFVAGALHALRVCQTARHEVAELAEVNQRLAELNQLKNEFVSTVAHELRIPLAGVAAHIWTLTEYWDRLTDEQRRSSIHVVRRRVERLERLTAELLTLSRAEAGWPVEVTNQPVDLAPIICQVSADLTEDYGAERVIVELPPALPRVQADGSRTEEVLANLIDNGLKFSPADRPVVVKAEVTESEVVVHVIDQGRGIRAEDTSRLFQPYVRLTSDDWPAQPGTGIGLYLSRKFIEAQGGRMFADSEYGKGSTFSFALRRVVEDGGH